VLACREDGKKLFEEGDFDKALQVFTRGCDILMMAVEFDSHQQAEMAKQELVLTLNVCACLLKKKEWSKAVDQCKAALRLDSKCAKARYRMAEAFIGMCEYDDALSECRNALELAPNNRDTLSLIAKVEALKAQQNEKAKRAERAMSEQLAKKLGGAATHSTSI